jgi:iron(III) transport system ATP-binding protein
MTDVEINHVGKFFGTVRALSGVDLSMRSGEFLAVLGPSGCGKTTLLRCVAGFEQIDEGRIALGGRLVALPGVHVPPHRRHVAVVPQEGALFPHLDVAGNVAYGLGRGRRDRAARVEQCLELVGLGGYGRRMPHELSGGQRQRVAVARALAPRPPLVLLDEPFSALDAALRSELRRDVRRALREDGATAILVTHDQAEALSMADRVAVMNGGRIRQVGTPAEVYRHPADAWVAGFVGEAVIVPLDGEAPGGRHASPLGPLTLRDDDRPWDGPMAAVVRPEQVLMTHRRTPQAGRGVPAVVRRVDYHGHDTLVAFELADGTEAMSRMVDGPLVDYRPGDRVFVLVDGAVAAVPVGETLTRPVPSPR